jgi:hypothetical protein
MLEKFDGFSWHCTRGETVCSRGMYNSNTLRNIVALRVENPQNGKNREARVAKVADRDFSPQFL